MCEFCSEIHFVFCDDFTVCMTVAVRGSRPGKNVQLSENEIRGLCLKSREIFLSQPILLELEAPLKICGWCPSCSVMLELLNSQAKSRF